MDEVLGTSNANVENLNRIEEGDSSNCSSDSAESHYSGEQIELYQEYKDIEDKHDLIYETFIKQLQKAYSIKKSHLISKTYEHFSSRYPLEPKIWLEWIEHEKDDIPSEQNSYEVIALYKRALSDYYSPDLVKDYVKFVKYAPISDNCKNAILEKMLSNYIYDIRIGKYLFTEWRIHLAKNTNNLSKSQICQMVLQSYEQELNIPLNGMESTYTDFKEFEETNSEYVTVDWTKIDAMYDSSKQLAYTMLEYENQLNKTKDNSAEQSETSEKPWEVYLKYITENLTIFNSNTIKVLYERFVCDYCLEDTYWLKYMEYVQSLGNIEYDKHDSQGVETKLIGLLEQTDWDIAERALRNCPTSVNLYVEKMYIGERRGLCQEEVKGIFECALFGGITMDQNYIKIWMEYLTYMRCITNFSNENEKKILRSTFKLAWKELQPLITNYPSYVTLFLQMWGRIEYEKMNDFISGKEIWTNLMSIEYNSSNSALWIEYAHLELFNGVNGVRKLYRKAITIKSIDNIHNIIAAWTSMERCNGTIMQLKSCQSLCALHLDEYTRTYSQPQFKNTERDKHKKTRHTKALLKKREYIPANDDDNSSKKKSKICSNDKIIGGESSAKRFKSDQENYPSSQHVDTSKDDVSVFMSNLDFDATEKDIRTTFPELTIVNINIRKNIEGRSRGYAYVELLTTSEVYKALELDRRMLNGRPTFISKIARDIDKRGKLKFSEATEKFKIFIKGIPLNATANELEMKFKEFGIIKEVRLVLKRNGESKGIAYIDYENEEFAQAAILNMNNHVFNGSKLFVAISSPPLQKNEQRIGGETFTNSFPFVAKSTLRTGPRDSKNNISGVKPKRLLAFIPRSVQKNALDQYQSRLDHPKSNNDFRMLLNKEK